MSSPSRTRFQQEKGQRNQLRQTTSFFRRPTSAQNTSRELGKTRNLAKLPLAKRKRAPRYCSWFVTPKGVPSVHFRAVVPQVGSMYLNNYLSLLIFYLRCQIVKNRAPFICLHLSSISDLRTVDTFTILDAQNQNLCLTCNIFVDGVRFFK